jgi:hypothetical protein
VLGDLWDQAQDAREPPVPAEPPPPQPASPPQPRSSPPQSPPQSQRRRWVAPAAALVVVVLAAIGFVTFRADHDDRPPTVCTGPATGPATVQPVPRRSAQATFCPVEINDGRLPITGPFRLSGRVLAPLDTRRRMVLLVASDPGTCDALGNPAPDAQMYLGKAQIGSPDGSWSYLDTLGYQEAVTYARDFVYVLAPNDDVLTAIREDEDHYLAAGGDEGSYAGLTQLPTGAVEVAHFEVPAGLYHGKPGQCR